MHVTRSRFDPAWLDELLRLGDGIAGALRRQSGFRRYYDGLTAPAGGTRS